jgi:hypothetical protein
MPSNPGDLTITLPHSQIAEIANIGQAVEGMAVALGEIAQRRADADEARRFLVTSSAPIHLRWAALDADTVEMTIRDHGPGIDPAILPHIFEPGIRGTPERGIHDEGAGLGLAIANGFSTTKTPRSQRTTNRAQAQQSGSRSTARRRRLISQQAGPPATLSVGSNLEHYVLRISPELPFRERAALALCCD